MVARIDIGPRSAALNEGTIEAGRDPHAIHQRHVDHQAAVADGVARNIVASRADRNRQPLFAREIHRRLDIGRTPAARDESGTSVDHAVPDDPRRVIGWARRLQHLAAHEGTEAFDARWCKGSGGGHVAVSSFHTR
nr:hypothetical protein [Mesorhizobium sp.]